MSKVCVEQAPLSAGAAAVPRSADPILLARSPRLGEIEAIIAQLGPSLELLDRLDDLLEQREEPPSLIVLAAEESITWLVANTGPLRRVVGERTPVVLVCAEIRRWELRAVLAAGAAGVVLEDEIELALEPCLRSALAGQVCVPGRGFAQIAPPALSPREKQILGLVVMGYMNGQIAEQLFLSESTIKSHLSSAFGKLGVRSRGEAVDLILDPERGFGMGILALGGEPIEAQRSRR